MADFPIIADISNHLVRFFRDNLCPETLPSPESVQLAAPTDKNADFQVGLFLYDIQELSEFRSSEPVRSAANRKTLPPKPLNLYYILYLNSKAQIASSAEVEQRVLARAIQALYDNTQVEISSAHPFAGEAGMATITFQNMSFEDKSKIWSSLNIPYQLGVFFSVAPVLLSSRKSEGFARVTSLEFSTRRKQEETM